MWDYIYKKRPKDNPLRSQSVESGKGIVGCEMKELNGWGEVHQHRKEGCGILRALFAFLFRQPYKNKEK